VHHFAAGEWGDDHSSRVPPYYYAQAQHNIAVTDGGAMRYAGFDRRE
jgi:hypothetical protein